MTERGRYPTMQHRTRHGAQTHADSRTALQLLEGGPARPSAREHEHVVQFYDDEAFLATVVCEFLATGLRTSQPVLVVATPAHRKAFLARLRDEGIDVAAARRSGQLKLLDARQTLGRFMRGTMPDAARFRTVIGGVIRRCSAGRTETRVRAYGEMVDLLWKEGNSEGALRLEELWNDLATSHDFALLCAYGMANFGRAADAEPFRALCAHHTRVVPTEEYVRCDDASRLLEISALQQRARALEAEILNREALEQRLHDTVAALQGREAELRDLLENAAEGIHLVGPDGVIQWANASELAMLGYAADEYIGRHVGDFHVDREVIEELLQRLSDGEAVSAHPARLRHRDGSIRHVLINSNVRWDGDRFLNTRCFTRDITALHDAGVERERALERETSARAAAEEAFRNAETAIADVQRARAVAEQANRAKSDFLAVMSHELRTPLNAIGGYAELIELGIHGPVTTPQRDSLERIQRSQRLLLGLVNQVLNYARIETGNVRYELENVALDDLLRSTLGLMLPQLRGKAIRHVYHGCDERVRVRADSEKLQQIVLNLLSNAVKFTERDGTVEIDVEFDAHVASVRITDTGIGIPREKLDMIFDPFVQVDANYTRTRSGVGLGLAISRDLAHGMGGTLAAESTEGAGSTFTLTIPRAD